MVIRKSTAFLLFLLGACLVLSALLFAHPRIERTDYAKGLAERKRLVRELGLTDLCLFTEARYTRNLSQADLFSAFQDYPLSFEHFPSGSIVLPPEHLLNK